MQNYCNKCGLCCKLVPAYNGNIIRDGIQPIEEFFVPIDIETAQSINEEYVKNVQNMIPDVQFYSCGYLSENVCRHPNKPDFCKDFPSSPVAIIDEICSFYGYSFIRNEALKQKIRKLKEEIVHYETLIITNPKEKNSYQKIINAHNNYIKKFEIYGSLNW